MNIRKSILLVIVLLALLGLIAAMSATMLKAVTPATPTFDTTCPTPDETNIPICAPDGETTPNLLPSAEAPGLLDQPAGP